MGDFNSIKSSYQALVNTSLFYRPFPVFGGFIASDICKQVTVPLTVPVNEGQGRGDRTRRSHGIKKL